MLDSPTLLVLSNFGVWREGLAARLERAFPDHAVVQADLRIDTAPLLPEAPALVIIETDGRRPTELLRLNQVARTLPSHCRLLLMVPPELADKTPAYVSRECSFRELLDILRPALRGKAGCPPQELPALLRRLQARYRQATTSDQQPRVTARELDVLTLIQEGLGNQAVAERLGLSIHTIKNHVHNILDKLNARRRAQAVDEAQRRGWLPPPSEAAASEAPASRAEETAPRSSQTQRHEELDG